MDDQLYREIVSLLLASAEQLALERAVLRGILQKAEGFDPSMLAEFHNDLTLQARVHAEFEPLWKALDRPETLHNALQQFQKLPSTKKPN